MVSEIIEEFCHQQYIHSYRAGNQYKSIGIWEVSQPASASNYQSALLNLNKFSSLSGIKSFTVKTLWRKG